MSHLNRRHFIQGLGATFGAALGARLMTPSLWANPNTSTNTTARKFLFIHAEGGWDPLCVFAPQFDDRTIQMEPDAEPLTLGELKLVDGPGRDAVTTFFRQYAQRSVILNGVSTRSVNHETCQAVALTGSTSHDRADWGTRIAASYAQSSTLPHLALSGPVLSGDLGVFVSRADGALQPLLDGYLLEDSAPYTESLDPEILKLVQAHLGIRGQDLKSPDDSPLLAHQLQEAQRRAQKLWRRRDSINFESEEGLIGQASVAINALAKGVCQCATIATDGDWDTHNDNSLQTGLFNQLFTQLSQVMRLLDETMGPDGTPLAKDTTVVVMSEMGRTPAFNVTGGRDHWPFTSFLLVSEGLNGGQVVGGYRDGFTGVGVDPYSLSLDSDRAGISAEEVGATLLTLGGLDAQRSLPQVIPLHGVLS